MKSAVTGTHLSLLILFSLLFLSHAELNLDPSDHDAFTAIQKDLSFTTGQRPSLRRNPCNAAAGVHCERRITDDKIPVLKITRIVFKSERLTGFLSPSIGRLSELRELSLPNNFLVDQLPQEIVDCRKLEILNLQNNKFAGQITPELSSLSWLRVLDLSFNQFSGNLSFLTNFPNLENLSLANNQFSGKTPISINSFRNLKFINFSGNDLLQIPDPLTYKLKFSQSNLPKRYKFAENSTTTSKTNSSDSASTDFAAEAPSPTATARTHRKSKNKKVRSWILGFLAGTLAGIVTGVICSLLFKTLVAIIKGGKHKSGLEIFSQTIKKSDLSFLEKEDGLASLQIIGRGGCGEVYRAELPNCNIKTIAIKKIIQPSKDTNTDLNTEDSKLLGKKMRQIRSEIQTVGKIRHKNLLSLLAHLCRPDCHYLVYEYMPNGSLQDILNEVSRENKELDWLLRHKIAIGIASGLEYLHFNQSPRIIHRDLKPDNILLDDDMEARIADFGLAKSVPDANTHVSTSNVAGTVGYIAPEYHQTLKFTDKCDIYSFGVILGVLVIGKLPSDAFFQYTVEMGLVRWMRNVMTSENPSEAIDPKLMGNGHEEQMLLVLKIACFCTLEDPKQRPNSKDVRAMLYQIKH